MPPVLLLIVAIAGWVVINVSGRRLRWRARRSRAGRAGAKGRVLANWADVSEMLAWRGVARGATETDDEYARRAALRIGQQARERSRWLGGGVSRMAGLARQAAFSADVPLGTDLEAEAVAAEIHERLFRSANARQLLAWAFLPRPGRRDAGPPA